MRGSSYTLAVPSSQRSFLALVALLGAFLIPVFSSSLRGLTHVLTCREKAETPFTMIIPTSGPPQVVSSVRLTREKGRELCGGLELDLRGRAAGPGKVVMTVAITNRTPSAWKGTVQLVLEGETSLPVNIGSVPAGRTASDAVEFSLREGAHELGGSLLIGP